MTKQRIFDSHVHLFRKSNWGYLRWDKNSALYHDHEVELYREQINNEKFQIEGLIFMECNPKEDLAKGIEGCHGGIEEYKYVGRIINGNRSDSEGAVTAQDSGFIKAMVPWAPLPLGRDELDSYVKILKEDSDTFKHVKGFRYLLQDKPPGTMTTPEFVSSLEWLETNNFAFDWGIDLRSGGLWQFEETLEVFRKVPNVRYIINHLTKPNLRLDPTTVESNEQFKAWKKFMEQLYDITPNSYMKLSGGYSELSEEVSRNIDKSVEYIYPWFKVCYDLWGPNRTIWDSNWPVCGMFSPGNLFSNWYEITEKLLDKENVDQAAKDNIYFNNHRKAYNM